MSFLVYTDFSKIIFVMPSPSTYKALSTNAPCTVVADSHSSNDARSSGICGYNPFCSFCIHNLYAYTVRKKAVIICSRSARHLIFPTCSAYIRKIGNWLFICIVNADGYLLASCSNSKSFVSGMEYLLDVAFFTALPKIPYPVYTF